MADTSYGNCCADEVAAQHVDAQLIVHFGDACMSRTTRLPVYHIFDQSPIDQKPGCLDLSVDSRVHVVADAEYDHDILSVIDSLTLENAGVEFIACPIESNVVEPNTGTLNLFCGRSLKLEDRDVILFIGKRDSPLLQITMLTHNSN